VSDHLKDLRRRVPRHFDRRDHVLRRGTSPCDAGNRLRLPHGSGIPNRGWI
jgi:hypothetical protein